MTVRLVVAKDDNGSTSSAFAATTGQPCTDGQVAFRSGAGKRGDRRCDGCESLVERRREPVPGTHRHLRRLFRYGESAGVRPQQWVAEDVGSGNAG
jgi:hypothetical protein